MDDREARQVIVNSIQSSQYKWRTARGVAKDTGLPMRQVLEVLGKTDTFVRAKKANARGETLYTTARKYREERPFSEKVLSVITNKIGE